MSFFVRWLPTYVAMAILAAAGLILNAIIRRDERREAERREGSPPSHS